MLAKSGVEPSRALTLLQMLIRRGNLVKIGDDLVFHRAALDALRARLAPHKGRHLSVPQFKDLAGVSRKYAIPLLEYLDSERITRRDGDNRLASECGTRWEPADTSMGPLRDYNAAIQSCYSDLEQTGSEAP